MRRRQFVISALTTTAAAAIGLPAFADDPVKVGLILPMTGPAASTGKQVAAGARLWLALNGGKAAGKTVELIIKDDGGVPDASKRIAQELVVNDHVAVLGGFGLTPLALAVGPVATKAKVPAIIMAAGTASIIDASPYFVRTSDTLPQVSAPMADWSAKNGIKTAVTLVSDYGPGIDAQNAFKARFEAIGGKVLDSLRAPLANPDFSAFLQKAKDEKPDALFLFVPSGQGATLMKQVVDRGLIADRVKIIGTGDVTDDDLLGQMGDQVIGMITSHHYSADHASPENKAFVSAYVKANPGDRPNFMAVQGYDGMALLAAALTKTKGDIDGDKLIEAMKGAAWMSPRGPISIDPKTRDIIQNIYIRKVEKKDGQLWNVEFETIPNVKDPTHKE